MSKKPRVIRKITKCGRDWRPKVAKDYKTQVTLERVRATSQRKCTYRKCKHPIEKGETYARVSDLKRRSNNWQRWPDQNDYHFGCVPPEARGLLRFFSNWYN